MVKEPIILLEYTYYLFRVLTLAQSHDHFSSILQYFSQLMKSPVKINAGMRLMFIRVLRVLGSNPIYTE